ncbi:response regulator transcription factor [Thalassobacter stenotrophicus]|uniref:response regulator transcription factor n=1 Tax=Thalassobacter stenotrophicus TaxID=266809 RepID=UPI0022A924CF|nr:response regulator transcription factor [Thalassobacter stenotrophicus]UYP68402.1 response regulator transcription factor [Thalassobacter stenotrophicus]
MYKILVVCDHTFTRAGFEHLISTCDSFDLVGAEMLTSNTVENCASGSVDVIIVDIGSLDQPMKTLRSLRKASETLQILAYCSEKGIDIAVEALDAGASGILTYTSELSDLQMAVRRVMNGDNYVQPDMAMDIFAKLRQADAKRKEAERLRLTARENQVVRHLMQGMTNGQISAKLNISEKTVKHYIGSLKDKFGAANRLEVVLEAQRLGV